jgi:hypothetical protein
MLLSSGSFPIDVIKWARLDKGTVLTGEPKRQFWGLTLRSSSFGKHARLVVGNNTLTRRDTFSAPFAQRKSDARSQLRNRISKTLKKEGAVPNPRKRWKAPRRGPLLRLPCCW